MWKSYHKDRWHHSGHISVKRWVLTGAWRVFIRTWWLDTWQRRSTSQAPSDTGSAPSLTAPGWSWTLWEVSRCGTWTEPEEKESAEVIIHSSDITRRWRGEMNWHLVDASVHLYDPGVELRKGSTRHLRHHSAHLSLLLCDLLHDDVG